MAGLRCALALAAVSLGQHDRVGVFPFADDLRVLVQPRSGSRSLHALARELAGLEPGGSTDFAHSLRRLGGLKLREGLVCVVSDFFDPAGLERVTAALAGVRHHLLLVQLVRPGDREPDARGELRLRDCETGESEDVSATAEVLARYRAAYDRFQDGLLALARRRGAGLLRLDVEQPVVPQLAALFEGGRYVPDAAHRSLVP